MEITPEEMELVKRWRAAERYSRKCARKRAHKYDWLKALAWIAAVLTGVASWLWILWIIVAWVVWGGE